jgi:hypothetical protein
MAKSLRYADAVRLLGGAESRLVAALEKVTGGLLLGGVPVAPALLGWFDAKAEFVRLAHELVRGLTERRSGLSRYGRTQRLEAAHTVLVVTAFFDGLAEAELPFRFASLGLTKTEELAIAGGGNGADAFVDLAMSAGELVPAPHYAHEDLLAALHDYYADLSASVARFVTGLAAWDQLGPDQQRRFLEVLQRIAEPACVRYEELLRQLSVDFPEVACWIALREHRATRADVRSVEMSLERLQRTLEATAGGRAPSEWRASLTRAQQAALHQPIVAAGTVPEGLIMPTLGESYVVPRFRAADIAAEVRVSDESWWAGSPVRDDLPEFLVGHLTSTQATRAPLLVLGQPGAGKSLLTRVLAAQLAAADFMPIRVELRHVPAAAELQDQIEHAIRTATGERVEWPGIVRSAGDALPVVLLDGFDELLQAIGVSQTDYLLKVAAFQHREANQGRPLAVVVTSRLAVADRARPPEETVALRLEPFDEARVAAWLKVWNARNARHLAGRGLSPLAPTAVLAHQVLAEQPLLLLMLALYDADRNALQRAEADLPRCELYERLLRSFARREVEKYHPGLAAGDLDQAVDVELRRLSVVAFAMLNRAALWVTEDQLDADLAAFFGASRPETGQQLRSPLRAAEVILGRFFFIHRANATQENARLQTYEFLHATFAEFLVARLAWQALTDIAARAAASTMALADTPAADDLLRALLSFAPLTARSSTVHFLREMAAPLPPARRDTLISLLIRLYRAVFDAPATHRFADYRPRRLPEPTKYAVYSANLFVLALCVANTLRAGDLYASHDDIVDKWRSQALLWRSQFPEQDWGELVHAVALTRVWRGEQRDIEFSLADIDGTPAIDPYWTFDDLRNRGHITAPYDHLYAISRREAYFLCSMTDDVVQHALEPMIDTLGIATSTFVGWWEDAYPSAAHALIDAWLIPARTATAEERRTVYHRCATIATGLVRRNYVPWDRTTVRRYASLLIDRLATDHEAEPALIADILEMFRSSPNPHLPGDVIGELTRCAQAFLNRDRRIDAILDDLLHQDAG